MSILVLILTLMIIFNSFVSNQKTDDFFPNLVQFYTIVPCGGVLIAPDWVLTAAQCLFYKRNSILVNVVGSNETAGEPIGVKATFIHPQFNMYSKVHDHRYNVALMKLYRPFNGFLNRTTGILVNIGATRSINTYDCCFIYGWDSIISSTIRVFTKAIQTISVLPRDKEACANKINDVNIVCASGESRKQCAGNPGSPIVCNEANGDFRVLGIASWTNFSLQCDDSSSYLNLTSFGSWIYNLVSMDSEKNSSSNNYSSTTKTKVKVNYYSNSRNNTIPKYHKNYKSTKSWMIKRTTEHRYYQDFDRQHKSEETTEDEFLKIFPLYQPSSSNLIYPINFLVVLAKICVFNL